jgi:PIN domain nuclease of toxin-antitoxin system
MKLLLDTHTLLWLAHEPDELSGAVREVIANGENEIYVSAVSAMEIATKHRNRKLEYNSALATDFVRQISRQGFIQLSVSCRHSAKAGIIASPHKDPWDRILAAQALAEDLRLATVDKFFATVGVATFW